MSAITKLHACIFLPDAGVFSSLVGASAQVRSFAKENASCKRYGVAQKEVLGWGLKSAHASGARLLCVLLRCAWLRCSASAAVLHVGVSLVPYRRCLDVTPAPQCQICMAAIGFALSVRHQSSESVWCAGFFFGFNSLVAMGSIVTVLWFGARQVCLHAWHRWDGSEVLLVIFWLG